MTDPADPYDVGVRVVWNFLGEFETDFGVPPLREKRGEKRMRKPDKVLLALFYKKPFVVINSGLYKQDLVHGSLLYDGFTIWRRYCMKICAAPFLTRPYIRFPYLSRMNLRCFLFALVFI